MFIKENDFTEQELSALNVVYDIMEDNTYLTHSTNVAYLLLNMFVIVKRTGLISLHGTNNLAFICGMSHDIGKKYIPNDILNKNCFLDTNEQKIMVKHTQFGKDIASSLDIDSDIKKEIMTTALFHHEKWDGTGYPYNLKGEQIPVLARLCSIADTYDAIISDRPYRKGKTHSEALKIIACYSGTQFDPVLVKILLSDTSWKLNTHLKSEK